MKFPFSVWSGSKQSRTHIRYFGKGKRVVTQKGGFSGPTFV
jgi:hypothetical protein